MSLARYVTHFGFVVETSFYSDVVECCLYIQQPVFNSGLGEVEIFSLFDIY